MVTTSDNKYDIIVDSNLNITVVKHQNIDNEEISLSYEEIPTESRAVVLRVYPIIQFEEKETKPYEEYAREYISEVEDGPELIQIFVDGFNYTMKNETNGYDWTWEEIAGKDYSTVNEFYQEVIVGSGEDYKDYIDFMISFRLIDPKGYDEKYVTKYPTISITCNEQIQTIDLEEDVLYEPYEFYVEFPITLNGEYAITLVDSDNNKVEQDVEITECKIEKYSQIYTQNTETTIDGYKVTIPAGFAIGTSENVSHVNTGLVITDEIDEEGNSIGSEFVWIPVNKDLTVGNTGKLMATLQDDSTVNYKGVLYDWDSDQTGNITYEWTSEYGLYHREPDTTNGEDEDEKDGLTRSELQDEYNAMVESVKLYGGFYVARYQMSIEDGNAVSKIGVIPTKGDDFETKTWYGLYSKAKTYTNLYSGVQSSMIWGSQYDAMLNFALVNGKDKDKVHSTDWDRFFYNEYTGCRQSSLDGTNLDVINNVYGLVGYPGVWTLEADSLQARVSRRKRRYGKLFSI